MDYRERIQKINEWHSLLVGCSHTQLGPTIFLIGDDVGDDKVRHQLLHIFCRWCDRSAAFHSTYGKDTSVSHDQELLMKLPGGILLDGVNSARQNSLAAGWHIDATLGFSSCALCHKREVNSRFSCHFCHVKVPETFGVNVGDGDDHHLFCSPPCAEAFTRSQKKNGQLNSPLSGINQKKLKNWLDTPVEKDGN